MDMERRYAARSKTLQVITDHVNFRFYKAVRESAARRRGEPVDLESHALSLDIPCRLWKSMMREWTSSLVRISHSEGSTLNLNQLRRRSTSLGMTSRQKTRRQLEHDCRLALEAQQPEVLQLCRRGPARASSLSAAPACGQEVERTTMVSGYAGASMHTASTAAIFDAQGLGNGGNALGAAVAELSSLNLGQLRAQRWKQDAEKKVPTRGRLSDCS